MANSTMESAYRQFEKRINALEDLDQNGESGFAREFQALRQTSFKYKAKGNTAYATKAGERSVNRPKNRFKDILPFDYSRVTLSPTGDNDSDYINANFIKGVDSEKVYIASQGPLPNTVDDFWRMLWEYQVKIVLMLCREEENGKKKCQRYWCESDEEKLSFGEIVVKTERCIGVGNDFMMRNLVAECKGEKLMITQFHYTAWPDHGVPETALPLIHLIKLVREYQPDDSPPIVVHCSAGCGRTGTICALDYTRSLLNEMKYKDIDPYRIVENLRKQRHAMVQTKGQYEFMCRAMGSLFREKLDLPIEEEHDDHLYENVVPLTPSSDSDSDCVTAPSFGTEKPSHQAIKAKETSRAAKNKTGGVQQGTHSVPKLKPAVIVHKENTSDSYVNVTRDLIDLSDDTTPLKNTGTTRNTRNDALDVRSPKFSVGRQVSAPDKLEKSQDYFEDTSSDYVIVPPRDTSQKGSRSLPSSGRYENVLPVVPSRPETNSRPVVPTKPNSMPSSAHSYENVEVQARSKPHPLRSSLKERPARPASPEKSPKKKLFPRSMSSSNEIEDHPPTRTHAQQKYPTCGASVGAKYADQLKAMDGKRARVLPTEGLDPEEADKLLAKQADLNSDLYAQVNKKNSARRPVNANTFRGGEHADGERAPTVPKKSPELLAADDSESTHDSKAKPKSSSLTNKIPFLAKRPELRGTMLDDIGYGKRIGKPKGPRNPPDSWIRIR